MNFPADLFHMRFYLVNMGILYVLAGCVPMPIEKTVAKPEINNKPEVVLVPVEVQTGCKGMLDYYELFSMMEEEARILELADMKTHLTDTGSNCARLKLGMVLSQPNTAAQDDDAAVELLEEFVDFPGSGDTRDQFLAKFILNEIKERARIRKEQLSRFKNKLKNEKRKKAEEQSASSADEEDALQLLARENEALRKKLEQLADIEKKSGEKEQATVKPLLEN